MNTRVVAVVFSIVFFQTSLSRAETTPQVSYNLDLSLLYLDTLQNPFSTEKSTDIDSARELESVESRSLGLKKAKVDLQWAYPGQSRLNLTLRLDSAVREEQDEYDTRAGEVYFKKQPVQLLDAYSIDLLFAESAVLSVGVFEEMIHRRSAYSRGPEFGLEVILPTKFAGAYLQWRFDNHAADYSQQTPAPGLVFDLWVHQGNGDRVEVDISKEKTHDDAPGANDPHLGVAAGIRWLRSPSHRLGVLVGGGDNHYIDSTGQGKRNEVFARFFNELMWTRPVYSGKVSFEYRLLKEKWQGDQIDLPSRTHQSGHLNAGIEVYPNGWVLWGAHYGRSKFHKELWVHGYQFDLGYQQVLKSGIELSVIASEERRSHLEQGKTRGGFVGDDGSRDRSIRRVALELGYLLGTN